MPIHWIEAVLRNLANFIRWNKSLREDHWLLPSQFSSQKNQGKPTLWAPELKEEYKVPFQLRINHCRLLDFSCFFQSASHLSDRDQLLPWVPSDLKSNKCRCSFPTRKPLPEPNQKPPFGVDNLCCTDTASLTSLLIFKTHQEKWKCDFNTGIIKEHSETIHQMW